MSIADTLSREIIQRLDEHFLEYTRSTRPLPPLPEADDTEKALLFEIKRRLDRLNWLSEGPDTYDTLDVTVGPTQETKIDYSPFLVWGVSLLNNAASGGDRVLLRFTDTYGRTKQLPIMPQSSTDLDLKGGLTTSPYGVSSVLRLVSQTVDVEVTGIVLLKWPLRDEAYVVGSSL